MPFPITFPFTFPSVYRLHSVEYDSEEDALTLELSEVDEFFLGEIAELNKKMDINDVYGQGATNIYQVGPVIDNFERVDASTVYPLTLKIYIPEEAIAINKVKLNWTLMPYRYFTKGASTTSTTDSDTGHNHTLGVTAGMPGAGYDVHLLAGVTQNSNIYAYQADAASTNSTGATHNHGMAHTHNPQIAEDTDTSPIMKLSVNGTELPNDFVGDQQDVDIADYVGYGWNTVQLYPKTTEIKRGRAQLDGFVQVFIESVD